MTNVGMLKERIEKSGYKLKFVAEKCGLTYPGLLPKLNGEREFNQTEIAALRELLNLTADEADKIFFVLE